MQSPIAGAGAYADSSVGGAAATGDGDVMLRFLPSYQAVESMRQGHPPAEAARIAMQRIIAHYPKFEGAIIAINKDGLIGNLLHHYNQYVGIIFTLSDFRGGMLWLRIISF